MEQLDQLSEYVHCRLKNTIEMIPEPKQMEFLLEFCEGLDDNLKANLLKEWNDELKNRHLNAIQTAADQYEA